MRYLSALGSFSLALASHVGPRAGVTNEPVKPWTISGMSYLGSYGAHDTVKVWRTQEALITVNGSLLDLSTGVEVKTAAGSAATGFISEITSRTGGSNTNIVVRIVPTALTPLGSYQVLLHYLVETSGPDKFMIRVYEHGHVSDLHILEASGVGGMYETGRMYTLVATGDHLGDAAFFAAKASIPGLVTGAPPSALKSPSSTEVHFGVQFNTPGNYTLKSDDFYDRNLPSAPPTNCPVQCFDPGGSFSTFNMATVPVVSSISTRTPSAGTDVTLSGPGLVQSNLAGEIHALPRYGSTPFVIPTHASGNDLAFTAPANMRQDSLTLQFHKVGGALAVFTLNLPTIAVQGGTPVIRQIDSLPIPGTSTSQKIFPTGARTMRGEFLSPYPLFAPTLTTTTIPTTFTGTTVQLAGATTTAPASPTIKFGQNDVQVTSSHFDQHGSATGTGVDIVTYSMFSFTDTITKTVTVSNGIASISIPNVLHIPPPTISVIRRRLGNGVTSVVTDGKLFRGAAYEMSGTALVIAANGTVIHSAKLLLNGVQQTAPPASSTQATSGTPLVYTVPTSAASGPLTAQNVAGTSTAINVTIADIPAVPSIVGFQLSPSSIVGGQATTATVALDGIVPAGTTVGNLVVSVDRASSLTPPTLVSVTTNPVVFTIPSKVTRDSVTPFVSVRSEASAANTRSAAITIVPPSPTAITLANASVVGGQPATATVTMNATATTADSIAIAISTDDPTTITVPARVFLNGTTATFQIPTQVVPTTRNVTIIARSGGQSRQVTLTVSPPSITTIAANPSSLIAPGSATVTVTLSASLPLAQTAGITYGGTGLSGPGTVTISGSSATFTVNAADVPTARTDTITVTLNGAARSGTITLQPLDLQSMTISPASVRASAPSSVTLQLNRAAPAAVTFQLTTSDQNVAFPTPQITFAQGETTKLVNLTTSTQTTAKTATITATSNRSTVFGAATITRTATITVNP